MEGLNAMAAASVQSKSTSSVGADLRAAREQLGWDLPSLAARLRIRESFLHAIEQGNVDELPGPAYAVGFVRTYATILGLDAGEITRRFREESAEVNQRTELVFPAPVPERGVPALAVVLVGLLIVIGAYVAWYRFSGSRDVAVEQVPAVPERLAPLAPEVLPKVQIVRAPPATTAPSPAPVAATPDAPPRPVIVIPTPTLVPVSTVPGVIPVAAPPAPPAAAAPVADPSRTLASLNPDGGRLTIKANAEAWIQIRDKASNTVVVERTLEPGETLPVPNRSGLLLTTGNAGGTQVLLDGQTTPSLGTDGAVRRGLPLEVDAVREGRLSATYAAPASPAAQPVAQPRPTTTN
jgi:cytoskeleton protein RodZ